MPTKNKTKSTRRGPGRFIRKAFRWLAIICLVLIGAGIGLFGGLVYSMSKLVPEDIGTLDYRPADATRIWSSDGVLLARLYEENRDVVEFKDIPQTLKDATVAIEDKRFYQHDGVDYRGMARAVVTNLRGRGMQQGGSTITQQLARNIYLTQKKTIARKLQEMGLAIALERKLSKDQILEMYLNEVYYGSGAYGVQSASRIYFGKSVDKLTLAESALIAGLTQRPTGYSPYNNMDAAKGRRGVVLQYMVNSGFITQEEANAAKSETVRLAGGPRNSRWKAPYFVSYVIDQVGREYGEATLYQGGLQIYTSLDYKMQQEAEEQVRRGVVNNRRRGVGQAALISIDPKTGLIRAMVGGKDFAENQFNVVTQGHPQPGSTFKPVLYVAALENGWKPTDRVNDDDRHRMIIKGEKGLWPKNYDGRYKGRMSLTKAVAESRNVPAIQVAKSIGLQEVIKYARALGISSRLPEDLSMVLGSASITPLEMCRAYCAIANGGNRVTPIAVTRISTSDNNLLRDYQPKLERVISENAAEDMDKMLRAVITSGTGRSLYGRVPEARGKTGTTDFEMHVWFIGYTEELVTAVWAGNDRPKPMVNASGSGVCGPIWAGFMRPAIALQKDYNSKKGPSTTQQASSGSGERKPSERRTERPSTITLSICDMSGLRALPGCPTTHRETFDRGNAPVSICDIHGDSHLDDPVPVSDEGATDTDSTTLSSDNARPEREPQPEVTYVNILTCAETGLVANTGCPHVIRKRFRSDLAPTQLCGKH